MDKKIFEKTEWKLYRYFEKDKKIKSLDNKIRLLESHIKLINEKIKNMDISIPIESRSISFDEKVQVSNDGTETFSTSRDIFFTSILTIPLRPSLAAVYCFPAVTPAAPVSDTVIYTRVPCIEYLHTLLSRLSRTLQSRRPSASAVTGVSGAFTTTFSAAFSSFSLYSPTA